MLFYPEGDLVAPKQDKTDTRSYLCILSAVLPPEQEQKLLLGLQAPGPLHCLFSTRTLLSRHPTAKPLPLLGLHPNLSFSK